MADDVKQNIFHFPNAPIVEAMIEIKLAEPLLVDSLAALQECSSNLSSSYPLQEELQTQQFQMQIQPGNHASSSVEARRIGFLRRDENSHRVVQFRLDAFAFSELKPYSSWERFFPEARKAWNFYRSAADGAATSSWTIRYINKISWPEKERIEENLNVYPCLPNSLPAEITNCFMRMQSKVEVPSEGLFTQQIFQIASPDPVQVSFIVDHTFQFSSVALTDTELWDRIERSRKIKNDYFKATFTEKALERFK
jgi:uncharacterized protein (TIGR04255 family)